MSRRNKASDSARRAEKLRTILTLIEQAEALLWDGYCDGEWEEYPHRQAKMIRVDLEAKLESTERTMLAQFTTLA